MKKILSPVFAAAFIVIGLSSCNCEDLGGWTPVKPDAGIQGTVFVSNGEAKPAPLANAEIKVNVNGKTYSSTTDEKGAYLITEVEPGQAEANVILPTEIAKYTGERVRKVEIKQSSIATCNFIFVKTSSKMSVEKKGHDDLYTIALPDVVQEDKDVVQIASYYIPEGTLRAGEVLELEASYELRDNIYGTKATEIPLVDEEGYKYTGKNIDVTVFAKTNFESAEALELFDIEIKDLMTPICVVHAGVEVDVVRDPAKNVTSFPTKILGKTVLTYPIYVKETGEGQESLTFEPSEYMSTGSRLRIKSKYFMKYVEYNWAVQTPTILWQYAVLMKGYISEGDYQYYIASPLVPKGETVIIDGWQHYIQTTYKCGWAKVNVKEYDQIFIQYKDRKHTGGSN